jgi:aldose 1-epimerase
MNTRISPSIEKDLYGNVDGKLVERFTLNNANGIEVSIITYGGIITSIKTPNKNNISENIVLGYDSLTKYAESNPYFGAIIGRYSNRIALGKFKIDDIQYTLKRNNDKNNLHGGIMCYGKLLQKPAMIPFL